MVNMGPLVRDGVGCFYKRAQDQSSNPPNKAWSPVRTFILSPQLVIGQTKNARKRQKVVKIRLVSIENKVAISQVYTMKSECE